VRIAGRVDAARRQRGTKGSGMGCLVTLQFTTSKQRELLCGLSHRTRQEASFSFVAEYRSEIIGVRTLLPELPIVTSVKTQPSSASATSSLPALPLVSSSASVSRAVAERVARPHDASSSLLGGETHLRALGEAVASIESRIRHVTAAAGLGVASSQSKVAPAPSSETGGAPALAAGALQRCMPATSAEGGEAAEASELARLEVDHSRLRTQLDCLIESQTCKVRREPRAGMSGGLPAASLRP
jgi:hypothetical protein